MTKADILAELTRLQPNELAEVQAKLDELVDAREAHADLEQSLLDRIDGPSAVELTPEMWSALQTRVQRRLEKKNP